MIAALNNTVVFVTGVSGFIGSHLARRLVAEGAKVHGLVRKSSNLWRIQDFRDQIEFHYADLRDFESVKKAVQDISPQKIFHLSAYVDVDRSPALMAEMVEVNVKGTLNLLQALGGIPYDCFVNTGASEEYGDNPVPFRESQMPNPVSPYSASKVATTMFCQMLHKTQGLPIVTLRPFLTYGPRQESRMLIPSLIQQTLRSEAFEMTGGEQTREFNYIDDIVDGFVRASVTPGAIGEIINIGNGLEHKVKDVVEAVLSLMNSSVKPKIGALNYRPGEAWHFYCDNTKARRILGWEPRVNLGDGLKKTIDWYREYYLKNNQDVAKMGERSAHHG
ncbi:MAG: SDR family NAD(P)-dependent oxidoreductase [Dehalococcoidales bacterium]